jgi:hypothetical protein
MIDRRMRAVMAVVAMVGLAACGHDTEQPLQTVSVEPLPEIGREVGDGPDVFGRIGDVEIDERGNVYVLDRLAAAVQVFDEDGTFLQTLGRRGQGPGELENPVALGWGPEGHLWVVDPGNGRYTVFDAEGGLVGTHVREVQGVAGDWPVTFTEDGRFFDVTFELGPGGPSPVPVEHEISGGQVERIGQVELPPVDRWGRGGIQVEQEGQLLLIEVPFSPVHLWHIDELGNLWYANTANYEVRRRSLRDGSELVVRGSNEPPDVTQEEVEAALERDPLLERQMIPATKPSIAGFFVGEEGDLWVVLASESHERSDGSLADVYDSVGDLVATLELTLELGPRPKVRNGILVGVITDDMGVERVGRLRVVR